MITFIRSAGWNFITVFLAASVHASAPMQSGTHLIVRVNAGGE